MLQGLLQTLSCEDSVVPAQRTGRPGLLRQVGLMVEAAVGPFRRKESSFSRWLWETTPKGNVRSLLTSYTNVSRKWVRDLSMHAKAAERTREPPASASRHWT